MSKIFYDFDNVQRIMDNYIKIANEFESLKNSFNSITVNYEELKTSLRSAKQSTITNIDEIIDVLTINSKKVKELCDAYNNYENQQIAKNTLLNKNYDNIKVLSSNSYGDRNGKITSEIKEIQQQKKYKIKWGDTLSEIARDNNTTVDALLKANSKIKDKDLIYAGDTIIVPGAIKISQGSFTEVNSVKQNNIKDNNHNDIVNYNNNGIDVKKDVEKDDVIKDTNETSGYVVPENYRITSYHPGDNCKTGTVTGSGKSIKDFQMTTINGKNVYTYNGKIVVAAATEHLLKSNYTRKGKDTSRQSDKHYYKYNDEIKVVIDNKTYDAIVLDSCGAAMWKGEHRIDLFVPTRADIIDTNSNSAKVII